MPGEIVLKPHMQVKKLKRHRRPLIPINPARFLYSFYSYLCYIFVPKRQNAIPLSTPLASPSKGRPSSTCTVTTNNVFVVNYNVRTTPETTETTETISEIASDTMPTVHTTQDSDQLVEFFGDAARNVLAGVKSAFSGFGLFSIAFFLVWHNTLTQLILYPFFRLLFGTLYPAYASYKAVKTKDVKEYVKWMMYWIVFALFTCAETFTDVFLSWFPFYYEIKIILVIWLLSPATKGSSILYRKFVHPMLSSREQEIDEYINKAKEQSYKQVLDLGSKGVNALMQTAIKSGGGLVNQIKKSYSLSDLSDPTHGGGYDSTEETDSIVETRVVRRQKHSPRRNSPRRHTTSATMYFSEIDVRHDALTSVQSVEDISSGYSSGEVLIQGQPPKLHAREALVRTSSIGPTKSRPTRLTRSTTVPRKPAECESNPLNLSYEQLKNAIILRASETEGDHPVILLNDKARLLSDLRATNDDSSSSDSEFRDCVEYDGNVSNVPSSNIINPPPDPVVQDQNETLHDSISSKTFQDEIRKVDGDLSDTKKDHQRGGKYNKTIAPPPPPPPQEDISAIKATLVLKPGVVKSLGGEEKAEVFCHSPKLKRKKLSVSPSSTSPNLRKSPSRSRSKLDALSKLKLFPKKMNFWHKDDTAVEIAKSSLYDSEEAKRLSREHSKSDDDFTKLKFREKLFEKIKSLKAEDKTKYEDDDLD